MRDARRFRFMETSKDIILVTGASGFIGARLRRALEAKGRALRVLTRKPGFGPGGSVVSGDITDLDACRAALRGTAAVIHVAGEKRAPSRFGPVNVGGTRNLLAAARAEGVRRFVHVSSVGVIGADPLEAEVFDEDAPCRPRNDYEKSKWEAEDLVRGAHAHGLPAAILRPSNVFGDGDPERGLLRLLGYVFRGRFAHLGGRRAVCNYVYVEDVAQACLAAVEDPRAAGRTYNLSDDCPLADFIAAAAGELGVREPSIFLPESAAAAVRSALRCAGRSVRLADSAPVRRLTALNNLARFGARRIREDLGFAFPVGWREGLRRLVRWYRAGGLL